MNRQVGLIAALVILTLIAGMVGGWFGVRYGLTQARPAPALDEMLHQNVHLSASQDRQIGRLEADFARRRQGLEGEMRAANRDLARAIATEHAYGPDAERAIGRFHAAMGELQKDTVIHIMAMRQVLTADQAARFDKSVTKSLAPDAP